MDNEKQHEQPVDRLVGEYLERLADELDASSLISRICDPVQPVVADEIVEEQASLSTEKKTSSWTLPFSLNAAAWTLSTAAALVVAFFWGRSFDLSSADAATVLHEVSLAHSQPIDRQYLVNFTPTPEFWKKNRPFTGPAQTILWTRGDQFWGDAKLGSYQLVYGRDDEGLLWLSTSSSKGIELARPGDPLPEEIAVACVINSMSIPTLVDEVLKDFDLTVIGPSNGHYHFDAPFGQSSFQQSPGNSLVHAKLKLGHHHALIHSALMEIDPSDTLVCLILWTVSDGEPRGTTSFNLVKTANIGEEQYRLPFHLDEGATIKKHQYKTSSQVGEASETDREVAP
ncbi:Hypothetical protein PBC10988_16240 [Planctomycetales bacterium 10988]|nr:Hypothetical protein PBC10988_16240 [Planctomycetales bacterium 10988]